MLPDIYADILPGHSLGGVMVRTPVIELQDMIMDQVRASPDAYSLEGVFEARYRLADGAIEIAADVRNGKVFKICANAGYQGTLLGTLRVGMTVRDAMLAEPRLYYSEPEEMLLIEGIDGVSLDVQEIDPIPDEVPSMPIWSICVHIPELLSRSAQAGQF